ncbi:MAG TPA: hypothetical protein ENH75_08375, partial [archaeon]|nr:hypothetical protein [archaeon]
MEVLLKRAEKPFKDKIGEEKSKAIFEKIKKALYLIPSNFSGTVGPEIPRFLFTYSQKIDDIDSETVVSILTHVLIFTHSLVSLTNMNISQVNQKIINRTKSKMRNLLDLLKKFVEKAKVGELMKGPGGIENILTFIMGEESFTQFDDIELFAKKSKDNFKTKIGEAKADSFSKDITQALKSVVDEFKNYIDSDISKFLYKFSQDIDSLPSKSLEDILKHMVLFTQSLSDMGGKNKEQINQEIIKRSKNNLRGLFDLFKYFLDMAKEGKVINSILNFEDLLTNILGEEKEYLKFTDVGGFLKRVEEKYIIYLGEIKGQMLINDILTSLSDIPEVHRAYLASDISRFLKTYSETMHKLEEKEIEKTLTRTLMFTNAIGEMSDLNREETNQFILNRSKHKVRNLFELYQAFLDMEKVFFIKSSIPSLDEILNYTLGKFTGPKQFKFSDKPIYELLAEYSEELPIVDEYAQWAKSIKDIVPRYLETLKNEEGEKIRKQLWETKFPLDQISENYYDIIMPREEEEEIPYTNRLMHMLTYDILVDKNKNRALAGALAYSIFSKMLTDVFGGRNAVIHAIKVVQLLDERKFATGEKKKEIDEFLTKIVEEELNAIKRRMMNIKAIVPVLTLNEYYIKTYDITDKVYPEIVVKTFEKINPLKTIGKEKLEKLKYLNMIGNYNAFAYSFGLITQFHKSYFLEIEEIPRDAQRKFKFFQEFFEKLIDLEENIDLGKFYTSRVFNADRHIFLYILKYLYEPLMPVLSILEPLFDQNRDKFSVQSMVFYLSGIKQKQSKMELKQLQEEIRNCIAEGFSEDSDKMRRLKKMIDKQTSSIKFFRIMDDLLNESEKAIKILGPRIDFCREIFHFLDIAKTIHPSITATITQYLENLTDFEKEIDEVIVKVTDIKKKELISPAQFHEININASATKNRLIELASKDLFKNHTKELIKVSTKDVFGDQDIFKEAPESEPELAEEYNPLEEFFNKYREELTIVASTSTLENFQEAFTFWMKEDVLPLTLNKAEELLLKNIFKKIRKKLDVIFQEIKDQKTIIEASEAAESTAEVEDQPLAEISDKIPTDEEVGQQPLVEVSEGVTPDKKVKEQQVIAEKSDEAPIDTEVEEQQVIAKKSEVAPPVMEVELSQPLIEKSDEAPIDTEVEEQQVIAKKSDEAQIDTEVEEQQVIAKKSDEAPIDTEVEEQQV